MTRAGWLAVLFLSCLVSAYALINPNFTPVHVFESAKGICVIKLETVSPDGKTVTFTVIEAIKTNEVIKTVEVDFSLRLGEKEKKEKAESAMKLLKSTGKQPALIATGEFSGKRTALLHLPGLWFRLSQGRTPEHWNFDSVDAMLNTTFNGGTDMLIATMRFIRRFPSVPIMAAASGVRWGDIQKIAKGPKDVNDIGIIDVDGNGKMDLFLSSPEGDRLLVKGDDAFTEWLPGSASRAAVWADFDQDGRPDIASLSKTGVSVYLQKTPGRFTAQVVKTLDAVKTRSPSLDVIDVDANGLADLVAGIGVPLVLKNVGKGLFSEVPLPQADGAGARGEPGPCLVADFDGDGLTDLVQLYQEDGILYRGKAGGGFDAGRPTGSGMGKVDSRRACLGDVDGDGRMDAVLIGGGQTPAMLHNRGGTFEEVMRLSGEPGYIVQAGATCGDLADFNNDSYVDLFAGYADEGGQIFFNRGFRSYGICVPLKFPDEIEGAKDGQAAGRWLDVNGGADLELVLALMNGDVYVLVTTLADMDIPLCIQVRVDPKVKFSGPVSVRFFMEDQSLGVRNTRQWGTPATMGVSDAGEYILKYRLPGKQEVTRKVIVEDKPVEILIKE